MGASQLAIPIGNAAAIPPDVQTITRLPGGVLVPLTPQSVPLTNRNEALCQFQSPQGTELTIRRIHVNLPVWLGEIEREKVITTNKANTEYKLETEARPAQEGVGGHPTEKEDITPISAVNRYERTLALTTYVVKGPALEIEEGVLLERSVLPITPQVVVRFKGPEGELWSESFEPSLRYVQGAAGNAAGTGIIDAYADLTNPLIVNPEKTYSLALAALVPATVLTDLRLGIEVKNGVSGPGTQGAVTFFYDVDPVPVGK